MALRVHRPDPKALPVVLDDGGSATTPIDQMQVVDDPNKLTKAQEKAVSENLGSTPPKGGDS